MYPAKTNFQDHAHARLAWHVHAICPFSCTILAQSCTNSCKTKNCANLQVIVLAASLAKSCTRYVQDCARIVQEKGHTVCTCQASLACKILAQSCMILQVRFCWVAITCLAVSDVVSNSRKQRVGQLKKVST